MSGVKTVGVVGASGRAAAGSLIRAGFTPWVVDLFADRDTQRIAPCVRCPFADYPHGLPKLCDAFPPGPVIYTGGLENHPDVIRELASQRPVWGNSAEVVERVRDPFLVHAALAAADLPVPRVLPITPTLPTGKWVRKSRSSGGLGVRLAHPNETPRPGDYLQEFIDGLCFSAQFRSSPESVELLGVTEQLIGEPWLHAAPFHYAGNIGPVAIPQRAELERTASDLTAAFALRGLWGLDFILHDGVAYPIEVNPRYTAAMEVIEFASGAFVSRDPESSEGSAPRWHALPSEDSGSRLTTVGKAIYFAPHRITFPSAGPWDIELAGAFDPWRLPDFADIPESGEVIEAGSPVLTFFATGSSSEQVRERLQSQAAELDRLFEEVKS